MRTSSNSATFGTKLTTTGATSVFTCSDRKARISGIMVANASAGAVVVTVEWYDSSATTSYRIWYQGSVAANSYVHFAPPELWIMQSDEIRVTAGTANTIEVVATVELFAGSSS